jgi:hypothetical protein
MKFKLHAPSLFAGFGLAVVVFLGMGQIPMPQSNAHYRIVDDVRAAELEKLADEGWEFEGYLGRGVKGADNDETLWRRGR